MTMLRIHTDARKKLDDRDWMYDHYITKNLSIKQISVLLGISCCPISLAIKKHGITEKKRKYSITKITSEQFIERATKIFGDRFDYTNLGLDASRHKVNIRCKEHNIWFKQIASHHYNGSVGCNVCKSKLHGGKNIDWVEVNKKLLSKEWLENKINHGASIKEISLLVGCPKHLVYQATKKHKIKIPILTIIWTKEEFINRSNKLHDSKYDYSKVNFKSIGEKVTIVCPVHGEFGQIAWRHATDALHACKKCYRPYKRSKNRITLVDKIGEKTFKEMYEKLKNVEAMAKHYNVCPRTIHKALKRIGVK